MADNDVAVRTAKKLAAIIKATKPKANVYHWWLLGQGPIGESWPDMLSEAETEWGEDYTPWAHAYVIGYENDARKKRTNVRVTDSTGFRLWAFYGFKKGDADKNSSDIFKIHCKDVQNAITKATRFQQVDDVNGVPEVEQHDEWQITQEGVYWMGEGNKCHIAQGEIVVVSYLTLNPIPITS